jgi:hypothetical protein
MSISQQSINNFSSDKVSVIFSNIPTVSDTADLNFVYQNYVKSITISDYSLEFTQSEFRGSVINHPISKNNDDLSDLMIEFKLDENFINYFNLFQYVQEIRYGKIRRALPSRVRNSPQKTNSLIRLYDIKSIQLLLLDNERRTQKILEFSECFIHSLSTISLEFGKSDDVTFNVNIKYQELFLKDP